MNIVHVSCKDDIIIRYLEETMESVSTIDNYKIELSLESFRDQTKTKGRPQKNPLLSITYDNDSTKMYFTENKKNKSKLYKTIVTMMGLEKTYILPDPNGNLRIKTNSVNNNVSVKVLSLSF